MKGIVFNIERYSTEDGPGIRTVVFLKGCPLSCIWCANPESQMKKPQIMHFSNRCHFCGRCVEKCPNNAIAPSDEFGVLTDIKRCTLCGECINACYYGAREFTGTEMSVEEVINEVVRDIDFYNESNGGVTFSGGEPLNQPEFLKELIGACKSKGIHTAVETSLYADENNVKIALAEIDLVYADIKHINTVLHKKYTNVNNEKILKNFKLLEELNKKIIVRIPYIPDINDELDTQREIFQWVSKLKNLLWIEILPYHRLGLLKYKGIGKRYALPDLQPIKKEDLEYLIEMGAACNVKVRIGAF